MCISWKYSFVTLSLKNIKKLIQKYSFVSFQRNTILHLSITTDNTHTKKQRKTETIRENIPPSCGKFDSEHYAFQTDVSLPFVFAWFHFPWPKKEQTNSLVSESIFFNNSIDILTGTNDTSF